MANLMSFFLAIPANESVQKWLAPMANMYSRDGDTWTKPENLHLTLKLLSRTETLPTDMLVQVMEALRGFTFPFCSIPLGKVKAFATPRVLYASVLRPKPLHDMQRQLEALLNPIAGIEPHAYTTFVPHVTLCTWGPDGPPDVDTRTQMNGYMSGCPTLAVRRMNLTCTHALPEGKVYDPSFASYAWYDHQAHGRRLRQGKAFGEP